MLPLSETSVFSYWTSLLNFIVSAYFDEGSTVCILWNKDIDFQLDDGHNHQFVNMWTTNVEKSLQNDIFNYSLKEKQLCEKNLYYNALIVKLTIAIDALHCENFVAFQEDIPKFTIAFRKACSYSEWRSRRSKFLFAYRKDTLMKNLTYYFNDLLFQDQPNVLVIETNGDSNLFLLKTNKFVGPFKDNPAELRTINTFDGITKSFAYPEVSLYSNKLKDLQGRQIIFASFDYRPFVVFDYDKQPQTTDYALDNPKGSVHVDGSEVRILLTFCQVYNCTVEVDTTEKAEWGNIFSNKTGTGLQGMVISDKADMALGALYLWSTQLIDITTFLGRSGITCLVPKPSRLTSWILPLKPFQPKLWLVIFIFFTLEAAALLMTYRAELLLVFGIEDKKWSESLSFGYATAFKIFISQPLNINGVSLSLRIMLFSCLTIDIILTNSYGAGLASILTLPTLAEAPDSLERFHKFRIPWTATSEDWIYSLEKSDQPFVKDLLDTYEIHSFAEMRELSKTENMGFIVEHTMYGHFGNVDYLTQESLDRLKLMIDDIYFTYTAGVVPRLWPYLAKFDEFTLNWHSSGMDEFWEMKVTTEFLNNAMQQQIENSKSASPERGPVKLDMANFTGMILVWCLGILISTFVFFGEIFYDKFLNKNNRGIF